MYMLSDNSAVVYVEACESGSMFADLLPPAGLRDFGADAERPAIAGRAYSRAHTEYSRAAEPH